MSTDLPPPEPDVFEDPEQEARALFGAEADGPDFNLVAAKMYGEEAARIAGWPGPFTTSNDRWYIHEAYRYARTAAHFARKCLAAADEH